MDHAVEDRIRLLGDWYSKIQHVYNELNAISKDYEFSFDQFLVIEQINEEHKDSPKMLSDFFKTSMPAISRKLNSLQAKGYIRKIRGEDSDQRLMRVEVTPLGNQKYEELVAEIELRNIQINQEAIQSLESILMICEADQIEEH